MAIVDNVHGAMSSRTREKGSNMKTIMRMTAVALIAVAAVQPLAAKDKTARTFVVVNEDVGVPVFPNDITDRAYTVLGEVKAGVRKATLFSKEPSQGKIYRELWERADKLGADAVVKVTYGDSHVSAMSWGKTNATGTAIRFNK
jgi:uncharacterized protein YbjQ (UPF0145 family)